MEWPRPPERIRELIREGAQIAIDARSEWLVELDRATLAADKSVADDPVLAGAVRRTNRANVLHWAAANVRNPGEPVPANLGAEPLAVARELVRRGLDQSALNIYRVGQNVAWRRWMDIAFGLTAEPSELHALLDVSSLSISSFIDATIAGATAQMQLERDELTRGTHAERREVVALILDGAPISRQRAETRLGYRLNRFHTAAVLWNEQPEPDLADLERAAQALARCAGALRPLSVIASAASRWVWVPGAGTPDLQRLRDELAPLGGVRVAIGPTANGIEGFRRSHLDALTTQRMMVRLGSAQRVAGFNDVQLVALATQDPEGVDQFVKYTLGDLKRPTRSSGTRCGPSSTSSATLHARPRAFSPTATRCFAGSIAHSSCCPGRCNRPVCTSRWRWRSCTGAATSPPPLKPPSRSAAHTTHPAVTGPPPALRRAWNTSR